MRCWGHNVVGQLGLGNRNPIPAATTAADHPDVDVGGPVKKVVAGTGHTCALLEDGRVRCWGMGRLGQIGAGNTGSCRSGAPGEPDLCVGGAHCCIGDDEPPSSAPVVDIGGEVVDIAAGTDHTCALLAAGTVRCWGRGENGQLGYGSQAVIGDDETPASVGDVPLGVAVTQLAMKHQHVCALTAAGTVRCWGDGQYGELGYGLSHHIGDDEPASTVGDVDVGEAAEQVVVGESHTCALLARGRVKCWGQAYTGQLGYGNVVDIGDDELPSSVGVVDVGGEVRRLVTARYHTCAILVGGGLRCWGANDVGLGGRGIPEECTTRALDQYLCFRWRTCCVGDNEAPSSVGEVEF